MSITDASPATQTDWPLQDTSHHPFDGEQPPCWADVLTSTERTELARFMDAWRLWFATASDTGVITGWLGLSQSAAVDLSRDMMRACAEIADLTLDVTQRAVVAA